MRETIFISTGQREELVDITEQVKQAASRARIANGLVALYAQGATGGLMIQENWDNSVQTDVVHFLRKLIPQGVWLHDRQDGNGDAHLVHFPTGNYAAPNLRALLEDQSKTKLFHYGRFDIAVLMRALGVACRPVYCTKIASKLVRTYTDRHGLKDLCNELLGVELSKQQQSSDWAAAELSAAQQAYAASDVLHLHDLRDRLDTMLEREGRSDLAAACFSFLPMRAALDLAGWPDEDIFAH